MPASDSRPTGTAYSVAIALFLAVLAFAVLGLVRSSSLAGAASDDREEGTKAAAAPTAVANGPVRTAQIPPPTRAAPTAPPSRTYLHPAPERAETAGPEAAPQPRR
jgi:hypothetical protein